MVGQKDYMFRLPDVAVLARPDFHFGIQRQEPIPEATVGIGANGVAEITNAVAFSIDDFHPAHGFAIGIEHDATDDATRRQ